MTRSVKNAKYLLFLSVVFLGPTVVSAQELHNDYQGTYRGKVVEVLDEEMRRIPGTDTEHLYQSIRAEILNGPKEGEVVTIENDYLELDKGDKFYFIYNIYIDGSESYGIINIDRKDSLLFLAIIFVGMVVVFGGWQGVRSLVALAGSFLVILYVLLPGILNGWNPLLASFLVAGGILFLAIFFTHGFNRESLVAYGGTMVAVALAGLFAVFAVHITDLSGFASDETVYLNFNTSGTLNFTALLLGAFIIGFLGVLDDIAVTQSAIVSELYSSNPDMSRGEAYKRAMRVGREHVGALVNTLVLAYTGASLPLLLYFKLGPSSFATTINLEIFATEIVRIIVGSAGLILTVPIVTLLAVRYLKGYKSKHGHSHGHSH
ncbi:MAG: YibE/F family protein [Parcubacteria group bacterium]